MNDTEAKEMVLTVPRAVLDRVFPLPFNPHVGFNDRMSIEAALEFRPRAEAEVDFNHKQVIPYVLVRYRTNYLCIQRTSKQAESRLHNKFSLGIGGHINLIARPAEGSIIEVGMHRELDRELDEEIHIPNVVSINMIGVINDDTNEVNRVHTGFVYELVAWTDDFEVLEKDKHIAYWRTVEELSTLEPRMETWSQIVYNNVIKPRERLV